MVEAHTTLLAVTAVLEAGAVATGPVPAVRLQPMPVVQEVRVVTVGQAGLLAGDQRAMVVAVEVHLVQMGRSEARMVGPIRVVSVVPDCRLMG